MQIGDVLRKVALGQVVTRAEANYLRLWGNQMQAQQAFVNGLQTGQSDIEANSVNSVSAETDVKDGKLCVLYSTALSGAYLDFDSGFTEVPPQGYFTWDSADPTKLSLTARTQNKFANSINAGFKFFLAGYFAFSPGSLTEMAMEFYDASDSLLDTQSLEAVDTKVVNYFHYMFPTVDTDISTCSYIKFKMTFASGSMGNSEIYIWLVR